MKAILIFITLTCLGLSTARAQSQQEIQKVKNFFSGNKIFYSWRNGGVLYGTYYFEEDYYCPSGKYAAYFRSEKKTVLDNIQRNSWEVHGTWEIIRKNGQTTLKTTDSSGQTWYAPVYMQSNGKIWIRDGVSVIRQGSANCW